MKKDKLLHQILLAIQHLPVPFSGGIIHIEGLLNIRPDIVFLWTAKTGINTNLYPVVKRR